MILANIGVPMLFVQLPYLVVLLLPIIAVEAMVLRRRLSLPFRETFGGAARANLVSTFAGFPLAWLAMFALQDSVGGNRAWGLDTAAHRLAAVTLQAAWLIPYEGDLFWMIPAASLVLLVPCFPASVFIEGWQLRRHWPEMMANRVWSAVWLANSLSYALLLALGAIRLYLALYWHQSTQS
jgi:hypothetical protein